MNFFRRAVRYCRRQKVRSIILFLTYTLLPLAALLALSIGRAAGRQSDMVKETVGGSIHIEIDSGNMDLYGSGTENNWGTSYTYQGDYITQDVIDAISQVDGVVACSAQNEGGYWGAAVDFEYFPGAFNVSYTDYGQSVPYTVTFNSALNSKFLNGTYTLEEGRHITPEDSYAVMISRELAEKNGLSAGDSLTLYSLDSDTKNTFEIVGIFSGTEGLTKDAMMSDGIPANQGFIDMNSYNEIFDRQALELGSVDVYVNSAENIENIQNTIENLPELKGKTFTYAADTESFDLISHPLSSLQTMIDTAVAAIAAAGTALVALLLTLWTRSRKREAGILLSLGRNKGEILLQFLTENFLLAVPAAAASWGLTSLLTDLAGSLLAGRLSEAGSLTVSLSLSDAAAVCLTGLVCLILAVLFAGVTIIRLRPGAILSQMD